jgi:type IV secretory pathway TraG/TraD family ATPase VirD4
MWAGLIAVAIVIGILMSYFGIRRSQMIETYLLLSIGFYISMDSIKTSMKRRGVLEKMWPKPNLRYSEAQDWKCMALAAKQNSTFLGYEDNGQPFYWTDDQRAMQTNLPGVSGAGKSTALLNILTQDIHRGKAVIFLDGKGEKELIIKLIAAAIAAGRMDDVRIIDPSHPEISNKYNPFYLANGALSQRVGIIFDSLGASQAKNEFFAEHQRAFLDSICNILSYTGKTLTFQSVLAAAQQPDIIRETIMSVRDSVVNNPDLKQHIKDAFEMDASILEGVYSEKDGWLTKIQGLLNSMKPFVGGALAEMTGSTENLVTIEDVIDKKLILLVSMNIGADSQPNRAIGRIIVRDVQAQIAKRYDEYKLNKKHEFISIVLDEFGLFAYDGFSNIIHTARQANAGFIFSFQSVSQLAGAVGQTFADDLASATNCKFVMRISNEDTAEQFIAASGTERTERVSYQVEKPELLNRLGGYEDVGRGTRQETFESRVKDHQLKVLPTGQMMALLPDRRMGVIIKHIHVRRPIEYFLHDLFTPPWLREYLKPDSEKDKLHISFSPAANNRVSKNGRRARKS